MMRKFTNNRVESGTDQRLLVKVRSSSRGFVGREGVVM